MFVSSKVKVGARAAALALALGATSFSANAVLERVGPVSTATSGGGYPSWYQDTTGLALEFCTPTNLSERDGGWCVVLTGDIPVVPEVFPTSFFDEHFYYMASAIMAHQGGARSKLILAQEAAFAVGPVVAGEQITFSRIRVVLGPIPVSGTYRFIHPYGEQVLEGVAGGRIFFSDDVGVAAGDFTGALNSRMGPFLLPSATPGGAEMPPVTAANPTPDTDPAHFGGAFTPTAYPGTGAAYIADPARTGPVTGSPLPNFIDSTGASRNHNIFRIEGPPGSGLGVDSVTGATVDWIETTDFALAGRIFTQTIPGRIDVSRASYIREPAGQELNVFATGSRTTQGRIPGQPRPVPVWPSLSFIDAPCSSAVDANGFPVPPFSAPASGIETSMPFSEGMYWGRTVPAAIPSAVCVKDGNARDANGNVVPTFIPRIVADEVTVTQAFYNPSAGTLTVKARSSDATAPPVLTLAYGIYQGDLANGQIVVPNVIVPPARARVISSKFGVNESQVRTVNTENTQPVAVADTDATVQGVAITIAVLANDTDADGNPLTVTSVTAVTPLTAGTVTTNGTTITFNSNSLFTGLATFAYTVSDGQGGTAAAPVSVTVNQAQNQPPVAAADSVSTAAGTPVTIAVLANDTDANGDPLSVVAVTNGTKGTVVNNGISVTYRPTTGTSGTDVFTYTVADGRGGLATGTVTVTVGPAPTITVTLADFIATGSEWRIAGTNSTIGATVTVRRGVDLTGPVIGTAIVSAARTWSLRVVNSAIRPDASNTISIRSTDGATRLAAPIRLR